MRIFRPTCCNFFFFNFPSTILTPFWFFQRIAVRVVDRVSFSCFGMWDNWKTLLQALTIEFTNYKPTILSDIRVSCVLVTFASPSKRVCFVTMLRFYDLYIMLLLPLPRSVEMYFSLYDYGIESSIVGKGTKVRVMSGRLCMNMVQFSIWTTCHHLHHESSLWKL